MRLFRGPCHYGRELLPELPFGWRELVTRGIIVIQRYFRSPLKVDLTAEATNAAIARGITGTAPFLVSRFGTGELEATLRGRSIRERGSFLYKGWRLCCQSQDPFWWDNSIRAGLCNNAGVFPPTKSILQRFADLVLTDVPQINVLGCYPKMPDNFRKQHFPHTQICDIAALEPFWQKHPWTAALAGRKILVIHSMPSSITLQYPKRAFLFGNHEILPDFELLTYRSINSAMGLKTPFRDWFEALNKMESDIAQIDFDIAIIGCGAYGMSLGAFIKRDLGKKAVHLGGMTQILFGIIGKRWEADPRYAKLVNANWIRPLVSDTPSDRAKIEEGCYW